MLPYNANYSKYSRVEDHVVCPGAGDLEERETVSVLGDWETLDTMGDSAMAGQPLQRQRPQQVRTITEER